MRNSLSLTNPGFFALILPSTFQAEDIVKTLLPARVNISSQVLFQDFDDEPVLLNLGSQRYFELDDIGARLWQLLAEDGDTGSACAQLVDEYDVTLEQLRKDIAV